MTQKNPTNSVKASTQDFVEIEEIKDDVVMSRDYSCCVVIQVGTSNFELLSEEEQSGLIGAYGTLLNSLSFPIQIVILSHKKNITSYLDFLDTKINLQQNETAKTRLLSYREFVKNLVKKNDILEKTFYITIPFSALEMGPSAATKRSFNKDYVFSRAKTALYPKRDHVLRMLQKAGLAGKVLVDQELVRLFYNLYNPAQNNKALGSLKSYTDVVMTS